MVLSLVLVNIIGIPGVLLATAFSVLISEYILKTKVVHKCIFRKSSKDYFIKNIKFFIVFILDFIGSYYLINMFSINSLLKWLIFYILFTIINSLMILLIFKILNEIKFVKRFKILLKRGA